MLSHICRINRNSRITSTISSIWLFSRRRDWLFQRHSICSVNHLYLCYFMLVLALYAASAMSLAVSFDPWHRWQVSRMFKAMVAIMFSLMYSCGDVV